PGRRPRRGQRVVGLAISLQWRVAAGATIALVAGAVFAVSLLAAPRHGLLARTSASPGPTPGG
ncbi:MAG TPA: hypothetical protein VG637_09735, partial [Actinomycetes bacterium]|nr:hypothetical protein [Actinomycetes bacterium]